MTAMTEPACWSWEIPPAMTMGDLIAADLARQVGLPVDKQVSREGLELVYHDPGGWRLAAFHDGRCAICGISGEHLVDDHCHERGMSRGRLCRSCNVREGVSGDAVFIRYRRLHPAALLGVYVPYDGIGWTWGWRNADAGRRVAYDRGPRPASTPWKAWLKTDALDGEPGSSGRQ